LNLLLSKPYLSTKDVANVFGISERTVTDMAVAWHESGGQEGIPCFKIGRSWRFASKDIQAFIDGKKLPMQQTKRPAATA
jgi:hypothetical protein